MSSGFISETELAEQRRVRQEEWEKVRQPGQPEAVPEEPYDHRSLYERLQEQKQKRDMEYEEAHKLKNMIKGLDDDEVEFLDLVDRSKLDEERRKTAEEAREIKDFRDAVASLQEKHLEERISTEIRQRPISGITVSSGRSSQVRLLAGAVVKKRPIDTTVGSAAGKRPRTVSEAENEISSTEKGKSTEVQNNTSEIKSAAGKVKSALCDEEADQYCRRDSDTEGRNVEAEVNSLGMRCIGILPGLGSYPDSSDSEHSSDTDQDLPVNTGFDLLGRKVTKICKPKSTSGR